MSGNGPLRGVKVLEIQGIGPGPFAAMVLAGLGASVLRVARPGGGMPKFNPVLDRDRCGQIVADLKAAEGRAAVLELVAQADALIEGFRPGVMERLGFGPDDCLQRNPRLVYGRITGWGREGPLAQTAGHDINYIALSGALHACGSADDDPFPPLNLVGDFGGGGLLLALGIACALLEAKTTGRGQVVDAAMVDGVSLLMAMIHGLRANGRWSAARGTNFLDGSAYYYRCYRCADGGWVAVGAIEPAFRRALFEGLGLGAEAETLLRARDDDPQLHERLARRFRAEPRAHWEARFAGSDACVTPVLALDEVAEHPHHRAWGSVHRVDGVTQPAPAPRFGGGGAATAAPWRLDGLQVQPLC